MHINTGSKAGFAINSADALSWHDATPRVAAIAERAGLRIRANAERRVWQVWATAGDLEAIKSQVA